MGTLPGYYRRHLPCSPSPTYPLHPPPRVPHTQRTPPRPHTLSPCRPPLPLALRHPSPPRRPIPRPLPTQARQRVDQLRKLGHSVDKVEFILMGGTFMSLPSDYRDYFVRNLHDALSGHSSTSVLEAVR